MTKRIVSGIFVLTALGALGVILAGALTSGEQLIVRFLTAVTVAALGLYVVSDLRLQGQADRERATSNSRQATTAPANSTAAFMATVTGQHRTRPEDELQPVAAGGPLAINTPDPHSRTINDGLAATQSFDYAPLGSDPDAFNPGLLDAPTTPPITMIDDTVEAATPTLNKERVVPPMPSAASLTPTPATDMPLGFGDEDFTSDAVAASDYVYSGPLNSSSTSWPPEPVDDVADLGTTVNEAEPVSALSDDEPVDPFTVDTEDGIETADVDVVESSDVEEASEQETQAEQLDQAEQRQIEAAQYAAQPRTELIDLTNEEPTKEPAPVAHLSEKRAAKAKQLTSVIRAGELQVINTLIEQGMLSTDGPITDRDVRTMVYVAFTSNELRKLILAGGTPDGTTAGDLELGPVELFDENRYAPLPKTVYAGPSTDIGIGIGDDSPEASAIDVRDTTDDAGTKAPVNPASVPPMPTPKHVYRRVGVDATVDG